MPIRQPREESNPHQGRHNADPTRGRRRFRKRGRSSGPNGQYRVALIEPARDDDEDMLLPPANDPPYDDGS
jgi:hypothetical protein